MFLICFLNFEDCNFNLFSAMLRLGFISFFFFYWWMTLPGSYQLQEP